MPVCCIVSLSEYTSESCALICINFRRGGACRTLDRKRDRIDFVGDLQPGVVDNIKSVCIMALHVGLLKVLCLFCTGFCK